MKKILLFVLTGLGILILPNMVFGEVTSIGGLVNNLRTALYLALGGIVGISWIIVAILFLSTAGSPEKFNIAKKALMWTIAGTALYALGGWILLIIKEAFLG